MFENLLLFSSGIIGLLTIILILLRYKKNSIANSYLVLIFLLISLRLLIIGLLKIFNEYYLHYLLENFNNLFILVFPLNYLYFKHLIENKDKKNRNDLKHFIIPLLFIFIDFLDDRHYINVSHKNTIFLGFFILFILFYNTIILNFLIKKVWCRKLKVEFVKQQKLIKNWTLFLYALFLIISLRLIYSFSEEVIQNNYSYGHSYLWISAVIWLIIFLRILIFPEILYGHTYLLYHVEEEEKRAVTLISSFWKNEVNGKIINAQDLQLQQKVNSLITNYMKEIDQFTADTDFIKDPKFSINDLANKLNIPKSHLAYLFKYHSTISFSDFKKRVRIKYALKLIAEDYLKTNTYDSLAKEIGFASYNTFFTSFKEIVGVTPNEYQN
jgi:AraC-like DNA-binding protein